MKKVYLLAGVLFLLEGQWSLAAGYLIKQGKGYTLCEAAKKEFDKLGSLKEPLRCPQRIASKIPGLTEPEWTDLDIEAHWPLVLKIEQNYLDARLNPNARNLIDQRMARWRELAKSGQAKLQVARLNIVSADDATVREIYKARTETEVIDGGVRREVKDGEVLPPVTIVPEGDGPETIARVLIKNGCDEGADYARVTFVTEDLKEIDLAKERWGNWGFGGDLASYKGRHYVMQWGDFGASISSDFGTGIAPFCTIGFDWKAYNKEKRK